ncbi:tetratricopeptide repeat-containing sulfotransferase family protein [Brevundimonas sp. SL161]|uniref:tetratricopeptide repeat-containing sulfotransferase family protein n=1 Tax=Brevundimonas sp. SL161 TaxID=2804613 RepID=UPI003CE7B3C6
MAARAGDGDGAAAILTRLVEDAPPLGPSWGPVSRLALTLGGTSTAIAAAGYLANLDRLDLPARLNHAAMVAQYGDGAEARDLGLAIVADHPNQPAAWHFLGSCRATLGDAEGAIVDFRRAIAASPDPFAVAPSWLALAGARTFEAEEDDDLNAMTDLLERCPPAGSALPEAQAVLYYAVAKARDDLGAIDAAFDAYARGAALVSATRPDELAGSAAFVDAVIAGSASEDLTRWPAGIDSDRPIFVLGLPRSGTTLVEQILVNHSGVAGGGELNLFRAAAMPIGGFSPAAINAFATARPDGFAAIGRAYLRMLGDRFGPEGRVVDKTLNHSRYLGLIHRVLPRARFIWLRREPGATAWSAFRTWFAQGVDWSWSLERIARYFDDEDRLHAHWSEVIGDAILTVPYEALTRDPGPWIARIIDHAGLPHEPGLDAFHQTDRAVTTASFAQVRRPIYTTSAEAWRRYERHLKPFFDARTIR